MKTLYLTIALSSFIFTQGAIASDFTMKIHKEAAAAKKQYCYTDFEVDLDGNWSAKTKYSNGKQVESIRLYSIINIRTKDNQAVITIPQNHHLKGSHGGRAREENTTMTGKLPTKILNQISRENSVYACTKVSDVNFKNIKKVAEIAKWVMSL